MARSTYVYLVTREGWPVAGFTVKKEMLRAFPLKDNNPYRYWLMRDGQPSISPRDVTDEFYEKALKEFNKQMETLSRHVI